MAVWPSQSKKLDSEVQLQDNKQATWPQMQGQICFPVSKDIRGCFYAAMDCIAHVLVSCEVTFSSCQRWGESLGSRGSALLLFFLVNFYLAPTGWGFGPVTFLLRGNVNFGYAYLPSHDERSIWFTAGWQLVLTWGSKGDKSLITHQYLTNYCMMQF